MTYFTAFIVVIGIFIIVILWSLLELLMEKRKEKKAMNLRSDSV